MSIKATTLFLLILIFSPIAYAENIAVIINKQNASNALSSEIIGDIYLDRIKRFPSGELATPLDLPKDMKITDEFYIKVVKKTPSQLQAHWSRLVFSGKGRPPKKVADPETVKSLVSKNNSMIGYINQEMTDNSIKVTLVTE